MTTENNQYPLLKIKRQFSESEAVAVLQGELKKAQFKNGELIAEISELKYLNGKKTKQIAGLNKQIESLLNKPKELKLTKEDLKDERFIKMKERHEAYRRKVKKMQGDIDLWRSKYLTIVAKSSVLLAEYDKDLKATIVK